MRLHFTGLKEVRPMDSCYFLIINYKILYLNQHTYGDTYLIKLVNFKINNSIIKKAILQNRKNCI